MMVSKGEIWLVNFNPMKKNNEMGKIRPALIYQNNELNHSDYPTTIIFPMSSILIDNSQPLRMRVTSRERLEKDSDIVIAQIRSIDNSRFIEKLASLSEEEMKNVKNLFEEVTS